MAAAGAYDVFVSHCKRLDASEDRKLATFFSFKGVLVDGTKLALPLRNKARPKPKVFMEELRAKAVQAMKGGQTLALDLGDAEGSKAPFWSTLCKPDGVRKELFICLLYTSPSPRDATLSRMPSSA